MIQTLYNLAHAGNLGLGRAARQARRATGGARVLGYIGGHGGGNLGDDLMPGLVRELFPTHQLVDVAESWHEKRLARLGLSGPRYFDQVVLGGGTLISPFWFGKVQMAVGQGLAVSSLGTGAGSCGFVQDDGVDLTQWGPLLGSFKHLGVRGPRSCALMHRLGAQQAEVVGDLALWLTRPEPTPRSDPPSIAVNLSLPGEGEPGHGERERFTELARALAPLVRAGWELRPYAMHRPDIEPTWELVRLAGDGRAEMVAVPHLRSPAEFFEYVGPATLNVAVRLHGAVLGCCAGVPPLMLGYRDKCLDFAESMGLEDGCVSLPSVRPGEVADRFGAMLAAAPGMRGEVIARGRALRDRLGAYLDRLTARDFRGTSGGRGERGTA